MSVQDFSFPIHNFMVHVFISVLKKCHIPPAFAWKYSSMQACREAQGKNSPFLLLSSAFFFFLLAKDCVDLRFTGAVIECSRVLLTPDILIGGPISACCEQSCFQMLGQLYKKDQLGENEVASSG